MWPRLLLIDSRFPASAQFNTFNSLFEIVRRPNLNGLSVQPSYHFSDRVEIADGNWNCTSRVSVARETFQSCRAKFDDPAGGRYELHRKEARLVSARSVQGSVWDFI